MIAICIDTNEAVERGWQLWEFSLDLEYRERLDFHMNLNKSFFIFKSICSSWLETQVIFFLYSRCHIWQDHRKRFSWNNCNAFEEIKHESCPGQDLCFFIHFRTKLSKIFWEICLCKFFSPHIMNDLGRPRWRYIFLYSALVFAFWNRELLHGGMNYHPIQWIQFN